MSERLRMTLRKPAKPYIQRVRAVATDIPSLHNCLRIYISSHGNGVNYMYNLSFFSAPRRNIYDFIYCPFLIYMIIHIICDLAIGMPQNILQNIYIHAIFRIPCASGMPQYMCGYGINFKFCRIIVFFNSFL